MKKVPYFIRTIGLLALGLMVLASCSNPTGSSGDDALTGGVIGSVSGVVYDTTTALPIEGVTVKVGSHSVTTDAGGAWTINDLRPGEYPVSYTKEGYLLHGEVIEVKADEYLTKDPFMAKKALDEQLKALNEWVKAGNLPDHPVMDGASAQYSWQYQNGVWVNGTGSTVEVVNNQDGTFSVNILENLKLDYTFNYSYSLRMMGLKALTGTLKGQLKVFYVTKGNETAAKNSDAKPMLENVKIYLARSDYQLGDFGVTPEKTGLLYGPVITDAEGKFSFTGLPVDEGLTLAAEAFTQDGWYFKEASKAYAYENDTFSAATGIKASNGVVKTTETGTDTNAADAGVFYLFTEGSYAVVTEYETNVQNSQPLTLVFNKAMDPAVFSAELEIVGGNTLHMTAGEKVTLSAAWDTESKKVTLTPAKAPNDSYATAVFPYSKDAGIAIGKINIGTNSKAKDGGILLNKSVAPNVFTAEAIRLKTIDFNPDNIAGRAIVTKEAIKLTFSKPVNAKAMFKWNIGGSKKTAEYVPVANDKNSFFVYIDAMKSGDVAKLHAYVASAEDPCDYLGGTGGFSDPEKLVSIDFSKAPVELLTPEKINIYDKRTDSAEKRASDTANFPVNSPIMLAFTRSIPDAASGGNVRAILVRKDSQSANLNFNEADDTNKFLYKKLAVSGQGTKTLTLTPESDLLYNETYYLALEITKDGQIIFAFDYNSGNYDKQLFEISGTVKNAVMFKTAQDPDGIAIMLKSTNIYNSKTSLEVSNATANFPVTNALELTFASAIPEGAAVKAALVTGSEPADFNDALLEKSIALNAFGYSADRKMLSIKPETSLKFDTQYYLSVEISKDGNRLFGGDVDYTNGLFKPVSGGKIADIGSKMKSIGFKTAKDQFLTLKNANFIAAGNFSANEKIPSEASGGNENFPVDGKITLTFAQNIPAAAAIRVYLKETVSNGPGVINDILLASSLKLTAAAAGATLTITPADRLKGNQSYDLALEIISSTSTYFDGKGDSSQLKKVSKELAFVTDGSDTDKNFYIKFTTQDTSLKLDTTNLYIDREPNFIGSYVVGNIDKFRFPVSGRNIDLTFTENIPSGAIIQAAIVKASNSNFGGTDNLGVSIALKSATDGKKLSLTPVVPLEYDSTYFLRLKITVKLNNLYADPLFAPVDFALYKEEVVIYDGTSGKESISFKTVKENPASIAAAKGYGAGSSTSAAFSSASISDGSIDHGSGNNLKLGQTYYVQFDKKLIDGFIGTYKASLDNGSSVSTELSIELSKLGDDVVGIKVTSSNNAVTSYSSVQIVVDGTPIVLGIGGTTASPKINTNSGNLVIKLGTVSK